MHLLVCFTNGLIQLFVKLSSDIEPAAKHNTIQGDQHKWKLIETLNKVTLHIIVLVLPLKLELNSRIKKHIIVYRLIEIWSVRDIALSRKVNLELRIFLPIGMHKVFIHLVDLDIYLVWYSLVNFHLVDVSLSRLERISIDWFGFIVVFETHITFGNKNNVIRGCRFCFIIEKFASYARVIWELD